MSERQSDGNLHVFELTVTLSHGGMTRRSAVTQAVTLARNLRGIGLGGEVTVTNRETSEILFYSVIDRDG